MTKEPLERILRYISKFENDWSLVHNKGFEEFAVSHDRQFGTQYTSLFQLYKQLRKKARNWSPGLPGKNNHKEIDPKDLKALAHTFRPKRGGKRPGAGRPTKGAI